MCCSGYTVRKKVQNFFCSWGGKVMFCTFTGILNIIQCNTILGTLLYLKDLLCTCKGAVKCFVPLTLIGTKLVLKGP